MHSSISILFQPSLSAVSLMAVIMLSRLCIREWFSSRVFLLKLVGSIFVCEILNLLFRPIPKIIEKGSFAVFQILGYVHN